MTRSHAVERVAVIGAGAAGALHLRALRRVDGLRIVALRDLDRQRAAALAARFGLPPQVGDPERFYQSEPQSIHIATPPDAHEELVLEALERGCHVLVEKPPALTVGACRNLLAQAARRGLTIGVNENTALDPLIRRARSAIADGRLGRLLHIDGFQSFGLQEGEMPGGWMDRLAGGLLEDLLPHLLTTARALAGVRLVPEHWRLVSTGRFGPRHDELRLFLRAGDALTVNLALSLSARPKAFSLLVRGSRAMLAIDLRNMLFHASRPTARGGALGVGTELVRDALGALCQTVSNAAGLVGGYREAHGSFLPLIRAQYQALRAGTALPAPLAQAIETAETIRTIWPPPQ